MKMDCAFYVVGGDMRSCFMSLRLAACGYTVFHFDPCSADVLRHSSVTIVSGSSGVGLLRLIEGECAAPDAACRRVLILPVPVTKDGSLVNGRTQLTLADIEAVCHMFDMVCGGVIPQQISDACDGTAYLYDYMTDDGIATANSVATAEGAICDAEELSDININGSRCLVTGFGRCARTLAGFLSAWGADVTVAARRREQRDEAEACGFRAVSMEAMTADTCRGHEGAAADCVMCSAAENIRGSFDMSRVDFCFNTVPAPVITGEVLSLLPSSAVIIDIASRPGGVDFVYCDEHDIRYRHSLGIPGRLSPGTSGAILADAAVARLETYRV